MPTLVKDFEPIQAMLEYSRRLTPALEEVLNGKSIPYVCKKYKLNVTQLRHTLYQPVHRIHGKMTDSSDIPKTEKTKIPLTPWEKLYCDILKISYPALYAIPDNLDELMPRVFEEAGLIPHELEVINRLYLGKTKQAHLAREDGVTRSSINQLLDRAMAKLRKPNVRHLLEYGITEEEACADNKAAMRERYKQAREAMKQKRKQQTGLDLNKIQENINLAVQQHHLDEMKQLVLSLLKEIQLEQAKLPHRTRLDAAGLPQDICWKLAGQNIRMVKDLYFMPDSIMRIFTPKQSKILTKYLKDNHITLLTQEQVCDLKAAMPDLYILEKVEDMNLPPRAVTCLTRSGITYRYQLEAMTEEELLNIRSLGGRTIEAIKPYLTANQIKSATE